MARPTVLVATTNPAMAYALQESLKEKCKSLGLKLEVCPVGDEHDVGDKKARTYDSAEALFDVLEKRDPMELADTLVVLDVGAELENAFRPAASEDQGWHVTKKRAGVAVELLLRFPQVFPVFLSPAVPITTDEANANGNDKVEVVKPTWREAGNNKWGGFYRLRDEVCTKHKPEESDLEACKSLHAFQVPLHFVSPLYGDGIVSTLARFARGMRCWFDPTGLRTLVRNRFLGTVFGSDADWDGTSRQREVLLKRLDNVCIAIDEEREFALLNAYTAYKFGRRAWIVTTFAEFDDKPLWVLQEEERADFDVVVLRDIDMRFPDIPDHATRGLGSVRGQLKSVGSDIWKYMDKDKKAKRLGDRWDVRVVSSNPGVKNKINWVAEEKILGQMPILLDEENELASLQKALDEYNQNNGKQKITVRDKSWEYETKEDLKKIILGCEEALEKALIELKYSGLKKPIVTLYDLRDMLKRQQTIAARLPIVDDTASSRGHGAPYLNLAMAESLLQQTQRCGKGPVENLLGAMLAGEAYELLLGMSQTTALEALLLQHKHEVVAEVEFPGVSHAIVIKPRQNDVEAVLYRHMKVDSNLPMKNMFLSQFWSELKVTYHNGEQFTAAEAANTRSLVHSKWMPQWFSGTELYKSTDSCFLCVKNMIVKVATSFLWWSIASAFLIAAALVGYSMYPHLMDDSSCIPVAKSIFDRLFIDERLVLDVVLSSITLQPMGQVTTAQQCSIEGARISIAHLMPAYVLFGLLISMLYRKVTRS